MICLCINNLHEVVVFQCISTLCKVSVLYYSMWLWHWCEVWLGVTMRWYGHWVVTETKDASYHIVISLHWDSTHTMVMHTSDIKTGRWCIAWPFISRRQSCPQTAVHLVNRSAQNIKITARLGEWRVAQWFYGISFTHTFCSLIHVFHLTSFILPT